MADQQDGNARPGSEQPERVGRVIVDYAESDRDPAPGEESSPGQYLLAVLAGIIAIALMIGAMLLILSGVFEM